MFQLLNVPKSQLAYEFQYLGSFFALETNISILFYYFERYLAIV